MVTNNSCMEEQAWLLVLSPGRQQWPLGVLLMPWRLVPPSWAR